MPKKRPRIAVLFDPYLPQLRDVIRGLVEYSAEHEPGWELVYASLAAQGSPAAEPVLLSRFDGFIDAR
ncbi:MAG: hypothetical protein AAF800_08550, partial [Planctomycetota bacterium]